MHACMLCMCMHNNMCNMHMCMHMYVMCMYVSQGLVLVDMVTDDVDDSPKPCQKVWWTW